MIPKFGVGVMWDGESNGTENIPWNLEPSLSHELPQGPSVGCEEDGGEG